MYGQENCATVTTKKKQKERKANKSKVGSNADHDRSPMALSAELNSINLPNPFVERTERSTTGNRSGSSKTRRRTNVQHSIANTTTVKTCSSAIAKEEQELQEIDKKPHYSGRKEEDTRSKSASQNLSGPSLLLTEEKQASQVPRGVKETPAPRPFQNRRKQIILGRPRPSRPTSSSSILEGDTESFDHSKEVAILYRGSREEESREGGSDSNPTRKLGWLVRVQKALYTFATCCVKCLGPV